MNKIIKNIYKYRIYPKKNQINLIKRDIQTCQLVREEYLKMYKQDYTYNKKHDIKQYYGKEYFYNLLNEILEKYPQLKLMDKSMLINVYHDIINSNKSKNEITNKSVNSITFKPNNHTYIKDRILHTQYGKLKLHNENTVIGIIQSICIKNEHDKWYVIINTKQTIKKQNITIENKIGIDLGLKHFVTLSNGEKIETINTSSETKQIKKLHEKLLRQEKDSINYNNTRKRLNKVYEKRTNKIHDYLHKISFKLVNEYDYIAMETLTIENMKQQNMYSQSIQNANWFYFIELVKYKCFKYDKIFVQVDKNFPSSKKCSVCGKINHKINIKTREWVCSNCKTKHDRDVNAAKNILLESLNEPRGHGR